MLRRLVCSEDGANKFWEGSVSGVTLTVRFGKVGTAGQAKDKDLASPAAAAAELEKLVRQKLAKGYRDDDAPSPAALSSGTTGPAPTTPHAPAARKPEADAEAEAPKTPPRKPAASRSKKGGKQPLVWGFLDAGGAWLVEPRFSDAGRFSSGLAAARDGALWGYVDRSGGFVVAPRFTGATRFQHGFAQVESDGARFLIDRTGTRRFLPLGEELAGRGNLLAPFSDGRTMVRTEAGLGYIDEAGRIVIEPRFDRAEPFSCGRARVMPSGGWQWGFIDTEGVAITEATYAQAAPFSEDLALVQREEGGPKEYIDRAGAVVLGPSPDFAGRFSEGLARVLVDGKWGFIDRTGRAVIAATFEWVEDFRGGRARVRRGPSYSAEWGYIDAAGGLVIPYAYKEAGDFDDGIALVWRRAGTDAVLIDRDGKPLHEGKLASAREAAGGLAIASVTEGWPPGPPRYGALNRQGDWVIPPTLESLWAFADGLAPAQSGGKWGIIDTTGAWVVPAEYDHVSGASGELIAVNRGGVHRQGGFEGGRWGFVDRRGNVVVEPTYLAVRDFTEGAVAVAVEALGCGMAGPPSELEQLIARVRAFPKRAAPSPALLALLDLDPADDLAALLRACAEHAHGFIDVGDYKLEDGVFEDDVPAGPDGLGGWALRDDRLAIGRTAGGDLWVVAWPPWDDRTTPVSLLVHDEGWLEQEEAGSIEELLARSRELA